MVLIVVTSPWASIMASTKAVNYDKLWTLMTSARPLFPIPCPQRPEWEKFGKVHAMFTGLWFRILAVPTHICAPYSPKHNVSDESLWLTYDCGTLYPGKPQDQRTAGGYITVMQKLTSCMNLRSLLCVWFLANLGIRRQYSYIASYLNGSELHSCLRSS